MLTTVAGRRGKDNEETYIYEAGEVYDLPPKEAKDLLERPAEMPRAEAVAQKPSQRAETRAAKAGTRG